MVEFNLVRTIAVLMFAAGVMLTVLFLWTFLRERERRAAAITCIVLAVLFVTCSGVLWATWIPPGGAQEDS